MRWGGVDWVARDPIEDRAQDAIVIVKERTVRVQSPGTSVGNRKESRVVTEFLCLQQLLGFLSPQTLEVGNSSLYIKDIQISTFVQSCQLPWQVPTDEWYVIPGCDVSNG